MLVRLRSEQGPLGVILWFVCVKAELWLKPGNAQPRLISKMGRAVHFFSLAEALLGLLNVPSTLQDVSVEAEQFRERIGGQRAVNSWLTGRQVLAFMVQDFRK